MTSVCKSSQFAHLTSLWSITMSSNSASNNDVNRDAPCARRNAGNANGKRPQVVFKKATTTVNNLKTFFEKELEEKRTWAKVDIVDNTHKLIDREYIHIQ